MRPEPSSRHPLIVFLLLLAIFSGFGYLTKIRPPASMEAQLHPLGIKVWALGLLIGGLVTLLGLILQSFAHDRIFHYGVLCELVGVSVLWPAAIIYAVAAFLTVGWTAVGPAGIVFAFGIAALWRMVSLLIQMWRAEKTVSEGVVADGAG